MTDLRGRTARPTPRRDAAPPIRIGLVGAGVMGRAHSIGYAVAKMLDPTLPPIELTRVVDVDANAAEHIAHRFGWGTSSTDWRAVTRANDIHLVDVSTPNELHQAIALDAITHGKDVLCEKPLASDAVSAEELCRAAIAAGVVHRTGFVYRTWPSVRLAARLVRRGAIGAPHQFRARYFHDFALDAEMPVTWRSQRSSGSGVDLGSHLIDLARSLVGEIHSVVAQSQQLFETRPMAASRRHVAVDTDDATSALIRFSDGSSGILDISTIASGHGTHLSFEVAGSEGAISFDWARRDELACHVATPSDAGAGWRRIQVDSEEPGIADLSRLRGLGLGYGDAFVLQAMHLIRSLAERRPASPDFVDGLRSCEVTDAMLTSADEARWVAVTQHELPSYEGAADEALPR